MLLSAGPAAAMISADVANATHVSGAAPSDVVSALSRAIVERAHDLSPDPLALECEQFDHDGIERQRQPAPDDPVSEAPTVRRRPRGSGIVLVDCDEVGAHAARGPPAG
jgi:hypothetical protein